MRIDPQSNHNAPWSIAIGLLASSFMTLLGITFANEPETILIRAALGGIGAALMTRFAMFVTSKTLWEDDEF